MRIADEIDYVMREFVACEDLFNALVEEQGLTPYQIASWMDRNEDQLVQVPMIECNLQRRDFRRLPDGWITDSLLNIRIEDDPSWNEGVGPGYRPGWLKPKLKEFFKATQVDFPEKVLASRGHISNAINITEALPASSAADQENLTTLEEEEKSIGTRERTTLLTIIAALAEEAKISLMTPSKSAEIIAGMTDRMGSPVAKRTIEEHLKKVPDALERKSR
ncbi:hypothetical protein LGR64_18275 [Delftia sp. Lp-1]|uniref:hypothetical protein n=1 Tax=Delftia sp. Lp-1 TaxID=682863 RepID=UPI001E42E562|nr:hypothetical protein [Delftia sp. Lp-1]MCB4788220.1 hypothetical protein [Delftia sp. Lp-1]